MPQRGMFVTVCKAVDRPLLRAQVPAALAKGAVSDG